MRSSAWYSGRVRWTCTAVLLGSVSACGAGGDDTTTSAGTSGDSNPTSGANTTGSANDMTTTGGGNGVTTGVSDEDGGLSEYTYYRADQLKLLKPGLVTKPVGSVLGQPSITAQAQTAVDDSLVNDNEPDDGDGVQDDGDGDGYVDLNAIIRFLGKVDTSTTGGIVTAGAGLCPYPYDPSQACGPLKLGPFQNPAMYTHGQDCALDGTDKVAAGSCFSSEKGDFTVNIQLIGAVPLEDTQVIGTWVDDGKGGIANGWIRGFLTEEVAKKTKAPAQLPLAATLLGISGGTPLEQFLADADKQASPPGWWFLLQYTAKPAIYDESVGPDGTK